jgi:multidrug resistance efflux pump
VSRRTFVIAAITVTLLAAAAIGLYARSTSGTTRGTISVAGDVRVDELVVDAPAITAPVPDYTVGLKASAPAASVGSSAARRTSAPAAASASPRRPTVSGFLSEVLVTEGASVTTGQVLARLDTAMLDLGVDSGRAAYRRARADLDALDDRVSDLRDTRATLVTARKKLTAARASVTATITVLRAQRASLETNIAAIQAIIAQPGGPPPHVPPYPVLLASLQTALGQLNGGLAGARAGLATIQRNLAKATSGLAKVDSALRKLRDARGLLEADVEAKAVAVDLAKARRDAAELHAPASGVVTFARSAGTVVMVGAPLVRIRPDGPVSVGTYLTSGQLAGAAVGTPVTVDFDSNPGPPLPGRVASIGDRAVVPPTGFPTAIVHMTRAVFVRIELDGGGAPAGTPVDIEIGTGSAR